MSLEKIRERTAARKAAGLIPDRHPVGDPGLRKRLPLPTLPPCAHEGPVVEACKSCGDKEGRHVRQCLHPSPSDEDRDTCTRAAVSARVQACATCPDYAAAPANGPDQPPTRTPVRDPEDDE